MTTPNITEQFNNLYSTTWQILRESAVDNIFTATPFWYYMKKHDRITEEEGGRWIGIPIEYATHEDAVGWISRSHDLSTLNTNADKEFLTEAKYDWKYLVGSIFRSYVDESKNKGKKAMMKLVERKLRNLEKSLVKVLEARLFTADGTTTDEINGLDVLVAEDPTTGTVGNIDPSTYTWWQNQYKDMEDLAPAVNLLPEMRTMFNDCSNGADTPNLIVTDQTTFERYEDETLEFKRIVNESLGDASFETLKFKGTDIVWSPSCTSNSMYFLNLEYLEFIVDEVINFILSDWKPAKGDLDLVGHIITMGNLITSNRRMHGVMFNIGETS